MPTVQIERRRRGFFGWIVAILFWGWQLLMAWALFMGLANLGQHNATLHTSSERTAATIGGGIGLTMVLFLWVLGTVILGFMMMFTRGRRELTTVERP